MDLRLTFLSLLLLVAFVTSQHRDILQYEHTLRNVSDNNALQFSPNREELEKEYNQEYPSIQDFVISLLVNPCGSNGTHGREDDIALGYDCCIGRSGQGEYFYRSGTTNKISNGYSNGFPATSIDEPLHNIDLVDEVGNKLDYRHSRRSDDILVLDESCVGLREPHTACIADRFAATKSKQMPPCSDYNHTIDATLSCFTPAGKTSEHCMQVAFSQNSFIVVCGREQHYCGTFLEIHKGNGGSPYDDESTILSETKITTPVTNGYQTTTLPLTYKNDSSRILCSYEEDDIQVGSMVRVNDKAPSCCCPQMLSPSRKTKEGAFFCPKQQTKEGGPFAPAHRSLKDEYFNHNFQSSFPWCPKNLDGVAEKDALMCTQERMFIADDVANTEVNRYSVRPCMPLVEVEDGGSFSSFDLAGLYIETCPYGDTFQGCGGLTQSGCQGKDQTFTYKGKIGKVMHIPDGPAKDNKYGVSFNDGRSVYWFARSELDFLRPHGNYQIWFVQRNRYEKIVQKKKPFKVSWPRCTFDTLAGRYFPYAQLDDQGHPIAAI